MEKIVINTINKSIQECKYGTLNRYIDVSNKVKKMIKLKNKSFILTNKTFNKDPYFGKIKQLIIIFSMKLHLAVVL